MWYQQKNRSNIHKNSVSESSIPATASAPGCDFCGNSHKIKTSGNGASSEKDLFGTGLLPDGTSAEQVLFWNAPQDKNFGRWSL